MRLRDVVPLALAVLFVAAGAALVAGSASAAPVPHNGSEGLLALDADPYPAQDIEIARGERVLWPVTAELDAPTTGELTIQVASSLPLAEDPSALRFELRSCPEAWVLPADHADPAMCAGGAGEVVISEEAFAMTDADDVWSVGPIAPGVPRYFLVTLSLPYSTSAALADEPGQVSFGFRALDGAGAGAGGLATTGATVVGPALLGLGLLAGGATVARAHRRLARTGARS